MYSLCKDHCTENNKKPIFIALYKEYLIKKNILPSIFHEKTSAGATTSKCCQKVKKKTEKIKEYNLHMRRKNVAKAEKSRDEEKAKEKKEYLSANFDLQAVLYSPLFHAKPIFYKRKLATFNLTVFDVARKQGYCYV